MAAESTTAETQFFDLVGDSPFRLSRGDVLPEIRIAYETFGTLNESRDNAVLLFHALSGSQHAAGWNPVDPGTGLWTEECHRGWWEGFIGPGLAVDTERHFLVCANYVGGCYGSTGPRSIDPRSGRAYGSRFPHLTASDIVDSQMALLDQLGIRCLRAVIGNSVGGLLALNLAVRYPDRVRVVVPVAAALEVSVLQKILTLEQILAIENDPEFRGGDYYEGPGPARGLALARMISHKTFISLSTMERRARREVISDEGTFRWYELDTPLESYMLHQGLKFGKRFDANTYLRILDIWQKYDLLAQAKADSYEELFSVCRSQKYLVFSISSDVCFYPEQQAQLVRQLKRARVPTMYITVHSEKGHDSFLLEPELYTPHLHFALNEGG